MKKYPIGIQDFSSIINDGFVYVDKTDLVYQLAKVKGVYFLSRPRRFGKSLLVSTIKYYFQGRKDLFKGLKMELLEHEWEQYAVFEIDFNGVNFANADALTNTLEGFVATLERRFGGNPSLNELGDRFAYVLHKVHEQTGKRCVVLVDEYDKPILDVMDTGWTTQVDGKEVTLEEKNRNILKSFYSVFKKADADLRFAFLTGVTKFAQVSVFSGFNNANDISMYPRFETICGITEEELYSVFDESIQEMAASYDETVDETKRRLKDMYDGYHFSRKMTDVYNPFSILKAFDSQSYGNFWFATATPTYLVRLLGQHHLNLNEIVERDYSPDEFENYRATIETPVPMIYQSGYLTIKDYNRDEETYKLDLPNKEVTAGFVSLEASFLLKIDQHESSSWVISAHTALRRGEIEKFRDMLVDFMASLPYNIRPDNSPKSHEKEFQSIVFILMRLICSRNDAVLAEHATSQGRADCIVEMPQFVYIFEFKLDCPADEALAQIEKKGYAKPYEHDSRKVIRVGCSFSSKTGGVSEFKVIQ
jgi:hypothetical protein